VLFISCAPPCDPVELCKKVVSDLQQGAPVRTKYYIISLIKASYLNNLSRFVQRLFPVSDTCSAADVDNFDKLAREVLATTFAPDIDLNALYPPETEEIEDDGTGRGPVAPPPPPNADDAKRPVIRVGCPAIHSYAVPSVTS
jgi:hypothetical protein